MEDIGDYLYLIVVAIAAIGSLFKNINKKKTASPAPEVQEEEENEEEYVYESIPEEVVIPKPVSRPQIMFERQFTEMTKTPNETIMSFDNTSDVAKLKARKEVSKTITSKVKVEKEPEKKEKVAYSLNTVEEARAAFISSEIFNRKY